MTAPSTALDPTGLDPTGLDPTAIDPHDLVTICRLDDLVVELGVAALLPAHDATQPRQIALFRMLDDQVFAVQQHDPFADANVLARGLVGTHSDEKLGLHDEPVLSSPMYKQVWSLRTGTCLDAQGKPPHDIDVFPVRVVDGLVRVGRTPAARV